MTEGSINLLRSVGEVVVGCDLIDVSHKMLSRCTVHPGERGPAPAKHKQMQMGLYDKKKKCIGKTALFI